MSLRDHAPLVTALASGEAAYFSRRSAGYALAEARFPGTRGAELLPFLAQHEGPGPCVDVFCGTGFLTRALERVGAAVLPLDLQTEMLQHWPGGASMPVASSSLSELAARIQSLRETSVYCLAGFHHCFDHHSDITGSSHSPAQEHMIEAWNQAAGSRGRIVCVDVTDTAPGEFEVPKELLARPLCRLSADDHQRSSQAMTHSPWLQDVLTSASLHEALVKLGPVRDLCMQSSPRDWFREVVSKRGLHGHQDCFVQPHKFIDALARKQVALQYAELPAPWVFPSYDAAVWFLATFFALPAADAAEGLDVHLGHRTLPDGGIAIGWRLGVLWRTPNQESDRDPV